MYRAVIFDLDGTLLDTSRDICKVLNGTLGFFNLPQITLKQTVEYVGNGADMLVERALGENCGMFEEVCRRYRREFALCDNALSVFYEGEEEALYRLKGAGVKLALVTNKPQDACERVYAQKLSRFNFDFVAGHGGGAPLKPDPYLALEAVKAMGVDKGECLFVGDGETDIETAKNAGMDCVSVLWGYRSKQALISAGGKLFAESFSELADMILR